MLKNKGLFKGALVLAPLRPVYSVWPKEAEKWEDFKGMSVGILHDDEKDDVLREQHDLYVMNFEGIEWLFGTEAPKKPKRDPTMGNAQWTKLLEAYTAKHAEWKVDNVKAAARRKLLFSKVDVLVVDELSKMKKPDTGRFKHLKPYLGKFARRWGLTGSPAANGLLDLFGQCYVLDLGRSLGQYITHYRNRFFYSTGFGGYTWKLQEGAEKRIYDCIKPLALTMQAEDYIDMPKVIPVPIYVDLPPKVRAAYDKMEDELFAEVDGKSFVAMSAAAASMKCEQIANGALYKDKVDPDTGLPRMGKREWVPMHTAKLDALEELLGELQGQPSLWAYHFGHDLERIVKTLGKDTPHMDVSAKVADKLVTQWNLNLLPYLFGHPASMGHGLNMQEGGAFHVGFFNIPWDFDLYDQFIRRVRRQGSGAKTIFVYHIIARGTVDEAKMIALHRKNKGQQELFAALKTYRIGRK